MALNQNLLATLTPIAKATSEGNSLFANSKSPIIRALVGSSMLLTDGSSDPTNADKLAYWATDAGLMEAGFVPATNTAVVEGFAGGVTDIDPGLSASPDANAPLPAAVATPRTNKPRGERPAPTIAYTGNRVSVQLAGVANASGRKTEQYPFAKLLPPDEQGMGDSFFVGCDRHLTDPANQLAGTVTGANKRYKDDGRVFRIVRIAADEEFKDQHGKGLAGARVIRVK